MGLYNNVPTFSYVSATGVTVSYNNKVYTVQSFYTNKKYIFWDSDNATVLQATNTMPTRSSKIHLVLINDNGIVTKVPSTSESFDISYDGDSDEAIKSRIYALFQKNNELGDKYVAIEQDVNGIRQIIGSSESSEGSIIDRVSKVEQKADKIDLSISDIKKIYNNDKSLSTLRENLNSAIINLNSDLGRFNSELQDYYKDDKISSAEVTSINTMINELTRSKANLYTYVDMVKNIATSNDVSALNICITELNTAHTNLVENIRTFIADSIIVPSEKTLIIDGFAKYSLKINELKNTCDEIIFLGAGGVISEKLSQINMNANEIKLSVSSVETNFTNELNSQKNKFQEDIIDTNNKLLLLDNTMNGSFKDNVISDAEKISIRNHVDTLKKEKSDVDTRHNIVYNNAKLSSTTKNELKTFYDNFTNSFNSLINVIDNILDKTNNITSSDKTSYENSLTTYKDDFVKYSGKLLLAMDDINLNGINLAKADLQREIDDVMDYLDNLEVNINASLKDDIISDAEKISIKQSLQNLSIEKADVDSQYTTVYNNTNLVGVAKTNLKSAYDAYVGGYTTLVNTIDTILNKSGLVNSTDKNSLETAFNNYKNSIGTYSQRVNEAIDSISKKATSDLANTTNKKISEIIVDTDSIKQSVGNLSEKVNTKADGSTVTNLTERLSEIVVDLDSITQRVTSTESSNVTLTEKVNITVKEVRVYYAINTSSTTAPTTGWSTTPPTLVEGKYIWSKTTTTLTNGQSTTTNPVCITGARGATGATGTGVESITTEYYLSTSKTTQTGGSWVTTQPTWSNGKYLWTRSKVVYKNPTSTAYTAPVCDSSWDAINDVNVGGRNLIQNSAPDTTSGWSASANWTLSIVDCNTAPNKKAIRVTNSNNATSGGVHKPPIDGKGKLIDGETYTISAWIRASKECKANFYNETMKSSNTIDITTSWKFYKFTSAININDTYHSDILYVTNATIANGMWLEIHSLQLEKGSKATDWTPAPEDVQSQIDTNKTNISTTNSKVSEIQTNLSSITSKVSSVETKTTTLEGKVTSHESRIKTAESKITDDAITNTVSKSFYTKEQADSMLGVFSDNLLLNSNFTDSTKRDNYWGNWQVDELYTYGNIVGFPAGEGIGIHSNVYDACTINSHDVQAKTGDTFTVSGTYRMESKAGLMKVMIRAFQGNYATWHDYFVDIANDGTDTVKTFSETFKIQAGNVHAVSVILWNITPTTISGAKRLFLNRIKLERGDTKTDWSDHPLKYSHYTKSEVQQKVDSVEYKFQQSGGSNLLYNSNFANKGWDKWFFANGGRQYTDYSIGYYDTEGCMVLQCIDGTNFHFGQDVRGLKGNTKYTFSVKLKKEHNTRGARLYIDFYDANGNWCPASTDLGNFAEFEINGYREYKTFTTPPNAVRGNVFIEHHGTQSGGSEYSLLWVYQPCLTEGEIHAGWSPHPSELHDGITKIDKDGITVSMSNGEGSQGYSKIDYEGLSIYNAQGQRKAWFGDDNTAYIDSLSANTIRSRDLVRYGHSRPSMYYVSTQATGDGTGRDANNRANSINRVFEYIREQHGAYSVCHNIVIEVWGGSYYEDVYIGGWLGSGCITIYFGTDVVWYGGFTIEENTMPVGLNGQGNPFSWVGGAIIEGRRNEPIIVRNSFVHIQGFRSRPVQYPDYGSNFVWAQHGSHVVITNCDLVKYWSIATGRYGYVHMEDCCGDIAQTLNQFWSSTFISKGVYTPLVWNGFGNYWNTHYDWTDNGHNSAWIPKSLPEQPAPDPPVVAPSYQWFENTFSLTNLRTVPEGSGSGTSSRSGEWGQGKWGSYKPHRGYANVNASGWCSGGRNFSAYLTLTRSSSGHGYAGAVPVPKIKRPDGSFWSCGVAFARGATHTFQLPSDIANAIANGSMTTLEMWAGTSTNDYSFYNSGSVRIVCEKQV